MNTLVFEFMISSVYNPRNGTFLVNVNVKVFWGEGSGVDVWQHLSGCDGVDDAEEGHICLKLSVLSFSGAAVAAVAAVAVSVYNM